MKWFICAALMAQFLVCGHLLAQSAIPPALAKARLGLVAATTKGNRVALRQLTTDDLTWVDRAGRLLNKRTVLQEMQPAPGAAGSEEVHIYPAGAIVISTWKAAKGMETTRVLQVWLQQGRQWRLAAHQAVAVGDEKVPASRGLSSPLPPNLGSAADIKAIEEAIIALDGGNRCGNTQNFAASVTDQFVVLSSDRIASKADCMNELAPRKTPQPAAAVEQRRTRVYGDLAITNVVSKLPAGRMRDMIVHVRQSGKWLRAAVIHTTIAVAAAK